MNVLIACEFSGVVRRAFRDKGHNAYSCDILEAEDSQDYHLQCDVFDIINGYNSFKWNLMIAHPPCTHLASSGARWFKNKQKEQKQAVTFFLRLASANIDKICVENPVGIISTAWRKPDQIIQPWQFGEPFQKTTCLWLKNLPPLQPTKIVSKGDFHITKSGRKLPSWYNLPPSADRWKERSRTFEGIAQAMANQWG